MRAEQNTNLKDRYKSRVDRNSLPSFSALLRRRLRFRGGLLSRPDLRFHHPVVQFILRILPNASQFSLPLPYFLRKQFLAFEDSVDTDEKMERLQRAGKIELLAVLVDQDVESVTCIGLRDLGLMRLEFKQQMVTHILGLVRRWIVGFHRFGRFPCHNNFSFRSSSNYSKYREVHDTRRCKELDTKDTVHLALVQCLAQAFCRPLIFNIYKRKVEPQKVVIFDRKG